MPLWYVHPTPVNPPHMMVWEIANGSGFWRALTQDEATAALIVQAVNERCALLEQLEACKGGKWATWDDGTNEVGYYWHTIPSYAYPPILRTVMWSEDRKGYYAEETAERLLCRDMGGLWSRLPPPPASPPARPATQPDKKD